MEADATRKWLVERLYAQYMADPLERHPFFARDFPRDKKDQPVYSELVREAKQLEDEGLLEMGKGPEYQRRHVIFLILTPKGRTYCEKGL